MPLKRVYWDANIFHALFNQEAGRVGACAEVINQAKRNEVLIYTSVVTFVECVWVKGTLPLNKLSKIHEETIQKFFQHKYIQTINCDRTMVETARNLIWQFPHLKPKDSTHVASALSQQVDCLHTYDDDDLTKISGSVGTPPLKICYPEDDGYKPVAPPPPTPPSDPGKAS